MRRNISDIPVEEIEEAVIWSRTLKEVHDRLGIPYGGRHTAMMAKIRRNDIDISHFKHPKKGSGITHNSIKRRLMEEREYVCSECGQGPEWQGKPLTLQLDHIDGDSYNSLDENLRFLCPNCHTQTDTYAGKHNGKK